MAKDLILRHEDLIMNPTPRVPVCLLLDASGSMSQIVAGETERVGRTERKDNEVWHIVKGGTSRLDLLNAGVQHFFEELMEDEVARYAAEVCVIAFAGKAEVIMDFESLHRVRFLEISEMAKDGTNLGTAVELALAQLNKRKTEYRDAGVDYFQPWLILMTDGKPTGNNYRGAAAEVTRLVLDRRLTVFPIGVGEGADMSVLSMFSPTRTPLRLKGLRFMEFFEWLSRSVCDTSRSMPGEGARLDIGGIQGWSEVMP